MLIYHNVGAGQCGAAIELGWSVDLCEVRSIPCGEVGSRHAAPPSDLTSEQPVIFQLPSSWRARLYTAVQ